LTKQSRLLLHDIDNIPRLDAEPRWKPDVGEAPESGRKKARRTAGL
jgi:hypothetical protein